MLYDPTWRKERAKMTRLLVITLLFSFVLCSGSYGKDRLRISVPGFDGTTDLILLIGQGARIFEKHGLAVELVAITGAAQSSTALSSGETDIDARAAVSAIQARLKGLDFRFIAASLNYLDYTIITQPNIKNIHDLKGKKVGIVRFGGQMDLLVRYLFRSLGLEPIRDFAILQVGPPPTRILALQSGAIDATILPPTQSYTAIKAGLKTMDTPSAPLLSGVLVARDSFLRAEGPTVTRFLRAYTESIHFFLTRKEESLRIMTRAYRNSDPGWVEHLYRTHQQHQIGRKPVPNTDGVRAMLDMMAADTPAVKQIKPQDLFDLSLLEEIDRSGFIDGLYHR
jgi:NitT/TauT family transport system substrate-binding protein